MQINWHDIRALNGSQANGFEELCAQLAREESPAGVEFVRKGTPDAGVECYCILPDGSELGWQAKFFDTLGNSQWSQIDKSVKTALEKHPKLVRYFVCTPLDRPDARIKGQKSAMQRWTDLVKKWEKLAQERSMCVEFVWWGQSELFERLSQNKHIGRRYFWFGQGGFDDDWFKARLDEAIAVAGPRYTPEVHVDLRIADDLDLFGRSKSAFDAVKSLARKVRKELQHAKGLSSIKEDPSVSSALDDLFEAGKKILKSFSLLEYRSYDKISFADIIKKIESANRLASEAMKILCARRLEHDSKHEKEDNYSPYRNNPFVHWHHRINRLRSNLRKMHSTLSRANKCANSNLMILKGKAGTGKTHLLCEFAERRIAFKAPTVLLMGQRFATKDFPWTQLLQHLDLPGVNAEEFVGALEAAAQAAGCRALVIIDALNEGQGRSIWPDNLAAFLSTFERSPWIGVLLSVRSTYAEVVIPENIRNCAVSVTHKGFTNKEYDAARTFFSHYGLELPSTPILQPEFQNPLLLKTLCLGLQARGKQRLPRGFHGITSTFDLYLDTVNERLAKSLDFNLNDQLVRRALEKIAMQMVKTDDRWLPRSEAENIVNEFLPEREFSKSLYCGLVNEGVLIEEMVIWKAGDSREEIVFISYDRFTDHIIADYFLKTYFNAGTPKASLSQGGAWASIRSVFSSVYLYLRGLFRKRSGLAQICQEDAPTGLIEALCILVPERTGKELVTLAPKLLDRWDIFEAFCQSVIWRKPNAVSKSTLEVLNKCIKTPGDWGASLDVMLTVATLDKHPFNAERLHRMLMQDSMPERDERWSTYLHRAWTWDESGAVRRIVDWALGVTEEAKPDERTVELCSITLAWMFTTSNRFLRDRATKALVSLLTGRFEATTRLVERFSEVDDLYVTERVYAVAYGVAMRSYDAIGVGKLASIVYMKVFAKGTPPVHLLLRDYARGVIERAIYLGSNLEEVDVSLIRPPYKSAWPTIPYEEEIQLLIPDLNDDQQYKELAKRIIVSSILSGDFASYVIGTNTNSTNWLSLRLDEDTWRSIEEREKSLSLKLNESERVVWKKYKDAEDRLKLSHWPKLVLTISGQVEDRITTFAIPSETDEPSDKDVDTEQAEQKFKNALRNLRSELASDHLSEFEEIEKAKSKDQSIHSLSFDLKIIQRYVLWRVFDLGWTTERFGEFDESVHKHSYSRDASKPERIGKKYQWIAYHEILAYIADHFQYREWYLDDDCDQAYKGPWQESLRDIDPSCLLQSITGGTSLDGHNPSWWVPVYYEEWDEELRHWDWIKRKDDIPDVRDLLNLKHPCDGTHWLNVEGHFSWQQSPPPDVEPYDVIRRRFWLSLTGYFICEEDADTFMDWARNANFWGRWMPEPPETSRMFFGEYGWSPAFRYLNQPYYGFSDWTNPGKKCPTTVRPVHIQYNAEVMGFDCSVDESYSLRLPDYDIIEGLGLKWNRKGADFMDKERQLAAFDPAVHEDGPTAFLIREDLLRQYLSNNGLALCWTILGEKWVLGGNPQSDFQGALRISGAYKYKDQGPKGFLNFFFEKPKKK